MNTELATSDKLVLATIGFEWLLKSGIRDNTENAKTRGGVNAWFDLKDQTYPFIYGEITGYAVCAYLFYHSFTQNDAYLEAAKEAGDWIIRSQYPNCGLIRNRENHTSFQKSYFDNWVFTFDQWVIVYGLANLAEASQKIIYLRKAEEMAKILMAHTVREDGFFYPIYDVETKAVQEKGDKWSRQAGSFHAKALMSLRKLYELTRDAAYDRCATRLASKTLSVQQPNGRFITQDNEGSTHLHPHIYTLEGLLSLGLSEKNEDYLLAAKQGIEWVLQNQNPDGSVYSFYINEQFVPFVRVDILAQALRVGQTLYQHGFLKEYENNLIRLEQKIRSYQITAGSQTGAFFYGQEQDGTIHYHANAWVTMFAAQALWITALDQEPYNFSFFV